MADIFLSYAKADRARASAVAAVLGSCGWSVFLDSEIAGGANWRQVVQSELDAAQAVVVLWSHAAVASSWVLEEAERGRRRLVSVMIEDVTLPIGFSTLQAVNLIGWEGGRAKDVSKLVDAVGDMLHLPPQQPLQIPKSPSYKRLVIAVAVLTAAVAAAVVMARWGNSAQPYINQEIVVDASGGMSDAFPGRPSKLAAVKEALRERHLDEGDNLALRAFGGVCHGDESRLMVPFGTSRPARIMSAASQLETRGAPTLVSGVSSALTDLQPLPHARRIIVITGHADKCYKDTIDAIGQLKQRLADSSKATAREAVALEMRFIGLALTEQDWSQVRQLSDSVGGHSYLVNTMAELNDVLRYVIEFEPAAIHVKNVWNIVDEVGKSMTSFAGSMNGRKFEEAQRTLDTGQSLYAHMRPSFDALAGVQLSLNFERFYKLAAENRSLQEAAFAQARTWIGNGSALVPAKSADDQQAVEKWNKAVAKWNEIVGKYNSNVNEMNRLSAEIVKEARAR